MINFLKVYFLPFVVFVGGLVAFYFIFMESAKKSPNEIPLLISENVANQASKLKGFTQKFKDSAQEFKDSMQEKLAQRSIKDDSELNEEQIKEQQSKEIVALESSGELHAQVADSALQAQDSTLAKPSETLQAQEIKEDSTKAQKIAQASQSQSAQESLDSKASQNATKNDKTKASKKKGDFYIAVNIANIRQKDSINSQIIRRMSLGQEVSIESINGEWAKLSEGGFISADLLSQSKPKKEFYVATKTLRVRETPSLNGKIINNLRQNQKISVISINNSWAELETGGFVSFGLIREDQSDSQN